MIPHTNWGIRWSNSSNKLVYVPKRDPRVEDPYTEGKYVRTFTHEMGHVFGIGDGYADPNAQPGIYRPDASDLGLIDADDVMVRQFDRLNISNTDIAMLILAYSQDEFQSFADYTGHKQSSYFNQEGKE